MAFDLINTAERGIKWGGRTIADSAKSIWSDTSNAEFFDKPGAAIAGLGKEAIILPVKTIGKIMGETGKGIGSLLLGTLKLGGRAMMLIPLPFPFPGECHSIAEVYRKITAVKDALAMKERGDPEKFTNIFKRLNATIQTVRNDTEKATTGVAVA